MLPTALQRLDRPSACLGFPLRKETEAAEVTQVVKILATERSRPEFDLRDPHGGRGELTPAIRALVSIHACAHLEQISTCAYPPSN